MREHANCFNDYMDYSFQHIGKNAGLNQSINNLSNYHDS